MLVVAVWDAYASETEVTHWLKEQGLGRVAGKASANNDYCDMESFEDLAAGPAAEVDRFCRIMELSDVERGLFVAALGKLDGPVPLFASRPASPSGGGGGVSGGAGMGVSRPASPSPMPLLGGAD